jgi:hypothetical protein
MRKPYCCDAIRHMYEEYYAQQQQAGGGDFPVYVGTYCQRCHGLGNILGSLFRRILPILKTYGPHALRTSASIVDDVSKGKSWKDATLQRVPETIINFLFHKNSQSGSDLRRRRTCKSKKSVKRIKRDIFTRIRVNAQNLSWIYLAFPRHKRVLKAALT